MKNIQKWIPNTRMTWKITFPMTVLRRYKARSTTMVPNWINTITRNGPGTWSSDSEDVMSAPPWCFWESHECQTEDITIMTEHPEQTQDSAGNWQKKEANSLRIRPQATDTFNTNDGIYHTSTSITLSVFLVLFVIFIYIWQVILFSQTNYWLVQQSGVWWLENPLCMSLWPNFVTETAGKSHFDQNKVFLPISSLDIFTLLTRTCILPNYLQPNSNWVYESAVFRTVYSRKCQTLDNFKVFSVSLTNTKDSFKKWAQK